MPASTRLKHFANCYCEHAPVQDWLTSPTVWLVIASFWAGRQTATSLMLQNSAADFFSGFVEHCFRKSGREGLKDCSETCHDVWFGDGVIN